MEVLLKYRYEEQDVKILFSFFPNLPDLQLFLFTRPVLELRLATLVYREANPEEQLEALGFPEMTRNLVLKLIQYWNWPISLDKKEVLKFLERYKAVHTELFFAFKRALALVNGRLEEVYQIDAMEKIALQLIDENAYFKEEDLNITREDLESLGFSLEQSNLVIKKILNLVKTRKMENNKSVLLQFAIKTQVENQKI